MILEGVKNSFTATLTFEPVAEGARQAAPSGAAGMSMKQRTLREGWESTKGVTCSQGKDKFKAVGVLDLVQPGVWNTRLRDGPDGLPTQNIADQNVEHKAWTWATYAF